MAGQSGRAQDVHLSMLWALAAALSLRVTVTAEGIVIEWLDAAPRNGNGTSPQE